MGTRLFTKALFQVRVIVRALLKIIDDSYNLIKAIQISAIIHCRLKINSLVTAQIEF
jgi:hypothetical protein